MKYLIDYEYGTAELYTPSALWASRFYELAGQCFGIRKSIGTVSLIEKTDEQPRSILQGEYERLCHNGDVIIWDEKGNKIKSEWDEMELVDNTQMRWISVNEMLPKPETSVLAALDNGFVGFIQWQAWSEEQEKKPTLIMHTENNTLEKHTVTHWMPMPEPPKEET